jgi:hypothetical protein
MTHHETNEAKAQRLLEPGHALLVAQVRHIKHMHTVSKIKSVDLVSLAVRALRSLDRQDLDGVQRYLTELLAVLIAEHLELNEALGFELAVRDDAHKVQALATRICLGEADDAFGPIAHASESPVEDEFQQHIDETPTEEDQNQ